MNNNGLVRYDLQQGQQSTVQPHIEESEVSRGSQIATALTQGFSQLLKTSLQFAVSQEKDAKKQKKAQDLSEMYSDAAELRDLFRSSNINASQRTVEIDKFYAKGLSLGFSTNELDGVVESSDLGIMKKTTKDLLQNVEDTYKDQKIQDQNIADALYSDVPDPQQRLDMYNNSAAATSNVQILFNKLHNIDPEVQLEYVKANYQQAMRVLVNNAFNAAYDTDQKNFTTETVQQTAQAIRQELNAAGFTQASIDYFVGNEEIVWKKIAQTNGKNIDEAKQDVDNKNQLMLNSQFSNMASQSVKVMINGKTQTLTWGDIATISKISPELAKTFAVQGLLNHNNASAFVNGTTPKTPTVFSEENIKLVIGPNAKITQGIIDTPEGSGKDVLISMNKDGLGQTAEDLKKELENIIATGEAGKESGRNNASLPMAAYRNATGNIQKEAFLKRPENEEQIFQEYSKLSAEYLQTLNGEKDLVMLYDESGRPRLYRVRVPQEIDTSAEALAKIPSTGDFMTDVVTNQAIKNYSEQPRKVTFEDVSNSEFFTRNFASAASQFLQDGITRTGQSKRDLIRQFNSLMMQNSAAAREWFKSETGSSADPSESWANDKVSEIRGGHYNTPNILQSNVSKKTSQGNTINLPQYSSEESSINIPSFSLENTEASDTEETDEGWEQVKKDETTGSEENLFVNGKDASKGVYLYMDSTGNVTGGIGYNYDAHPEAQKNLEKELGVSYADIKKDLKQKWESVNKNKAVKQAVFSKDYVVKSLTDNMQKEEYNKRLNKAYADNPTFEAFCNNVNIPANIRALLKSATYNTNLTDSKTITKGMEEIQKGNVQEGAEKLVKGFVFNTSQKNKNKKGKYTRSRTGRGTKMLNAVNEFLLSKGLNPIKDSDANSLLSL